MSQCAPGWANTVVVVQEELSPAAPNPTTPGVRLEGAGGELLAVVPFEGIATPDLVAAYRKLLARALQADGMTLADPGVFSLATYGQLYSLKPRLNELLVKVKLPAKK